MACRSLLAALISACVPYQPAPLDQATLVSGYNARRLDDPGLLRYLGETGTQPLTMGWQARDLTLTTWYFSPALDRARAARDEAIAAQITAGTREQPSLVVDVEHSYAGGEGQPPWGVAGTVGFPVELGGKRGARVARAQARTFVAEAELSEVAWQSGIEVRGAMNRLGAAQLRLADLRAELVVLQALDTLLITRYHEGVVSRADVAQNEADLQATLVEWGDAEREHREALVGVATALGVLPNRLDTLRLVAPGGSWCDAAGELAHDSLQALTVHSRPEVGRAMANYGVAEADVRVEISKQYPDLTLGPGLFFDHGINKWTVLFSIPSIPLHRNRGPIAEAEARRSAAAAQVIAVQDSALAEVEAGLDRCKVTGALLAAADSLLASVEQRIGRAEAAYERGETSRLELLFLELARTRAKKTRHAAEQQRREAGTRLEEAAGVWRSEPPPRWPDLTHSPRSPEALGEAQP